MSKNDKRLIVAIWVTPVVYKFWKRDLPCELVGNVGEAKEVFDVRRTKLYSLVRAGLRRRDVIPAGMFRSKRQQSIMKVYVWISMHDFLHGGTYICREAQAAINSMTYTLFLENFYEASYYENRYKGVSLQSMRDNFFTYYNLDNGELNIDSLKKGQVRYIARREKIEKIDVMRGIGYKTLIMYK